MRQEKMFNLGPQLLDLPPATAKPRGAGGEGGATRISIEFGDGLCRYSALTEGASVAERVYPHNPERMADGNSRLLVTDDPKEKHLLGRFLLDYLFPRDLRSQVTGSAAIILACNNESAKVYWELAAQPWATRFRRGGGSAYLGLARGLTRQLRTVLAPPPEPPPPVGKILRVLLVADTSREQPLPGAHQAAQLLLDLFERRFRPNDRVVVTVLVGPSKATTLEVLLRINDQPPFDRLHYAGHCYNDQQHPEKSGFLFRAGIF